MISYRALKLLVVTITLTPMWGGVASAAALVGQPWQVATESVAMPTLQQLSIEYARPNSVPFPASDTYTLAKAFLGRTLFHDTRLSSSGALSCASCHAAGFGYGDGRQRGIGDGMKSLDRRSPSIVDSAWGKLFMWDGRAATLEEQVTLPIENPSEMNQSLETLAQRLAGVGEYQVLFGRAFPSQPITSQTIASAIATYERTIVSAIAPFDKWITGDQNAVTDSAKRGFVLFNSKARCAACHGGWLFTDHGFHDIGLPSNDLGRGRLLPEVLMMQHAFKTPSLRETDRRGPYMHDGSLPTLEAVIFMYNQGGIKRPSQSELIAPLDLSQQEQIDVVAFLRTLTSDVRLDASPVLPR